MRLRLVWALLLFSGSTCSPTKRPLAIVLDLDGTLYDESSGVEATLVTRIHSYCQNVFGLDNVACDELHREHGSTIRGLRRTQRLSRKQVASFYRQVYGHVPLQGLYAGEDSNGQVSSGYEHRGNGVAMLRALKEEGCILILASNSPMEHVSRVLKALAIPEDVFRVICTPCEENLFATKQESRYWRPIRKLLRDEGLRKDGGFLLDDSRRNLDDAAKFCGLQGVCVNGKEGMKLDQAILSAIGALPGPDKWTFDDVHYIRAKNREDEKSQSSELLQSIFATLKLSEDSTLRVLDVGCGLCSQLFSLETQLRASGGGANACLHYVGVESNTALTQSALSLLRCKGYFLEKTISEEMRSIYWLRRNGFDSKPAVRACLVCGDALTEIAKDTPSAVFGSFNSETKDLSPFESLDPHLVVAACFADLFQPEQVVRLLVNAAGNGRGTDMCTLYMPITYSGSTTLRYKSSEQVADECLATNEELMEDYEDYLREGLKHSPDKHRLLHELKAAGAKHVRTKPSTWKVDADENQELWNSLMFFFICGVNSIRTKRNIGSIMDLLQWAQDMQTRRPQIVAQNVDIAVDIFFGADGLQKENPLSDPSNKVDEYLLYVGPRQVELRSQTRGKLARDEIELEGLYSGISSGTELKIWKGLFDTDSAVDTTIESLGKGSDKFGFPLRYGYSWVGRISRVGEAYQSDSSIRIGRKAFLFHPHGRYARTKDPGQLFFLPDGVDPLDAVFIPAVETAFSLSQEANPSPGSRVGVFGLGLVGLLVALVLSGDESIRLFAVDPLPQRRHVGRRLGIPTVLSPKQLASIISRERVHDGSDGAFDTSIEVSGHPSGLQSALDSTGYGGTIILGSWYGSKPLNNLSMGMDFHRSHLNLKVSQVSSITPALRGRWSKSRRFHAAWQVLKQIRPALSLGARLMCLEEAQDAYELLANGEELAVVFDLQASAGN